MPSPHRLSTAVGLTAGRALRALGLAHLGIAAARAVLRRLAPDHPALTEPDGPDRGRGVVPDGYAQGRADLAFTSGAETTGQGPRVRPRITLNASPPPEPPVRVVYVHDPRSPR